MLHFLFPHVAQKNKEETKLRATLGFRKKKHTVTKQKVPKQNEKSGVVQNKVKVLKFQHDATS